jgi:hypothetical protein
MQTFHFPEAELEQGLVTIQRNGWEVLSLSPPSILRPQDTTPLHRVFALQQKGSSATQPVCEVRGVSFSYGYNRK